MMTGLIDDSVHKQIEVLSRSIDVNALIEAPQRSSLSQKKKQKQSNKPFAAIPH
jgi:hypothetical protein